MKTKLISLLESIDNPLKHDALYASVVDLIREKHEIYGERIGIYPHSLTTAQWCEKIYEFKYSSKAPIELKLAGLLHDIDRAFPERRASFKDYESYDEYKRAHSIKSAHVAIEYLKTLDNSLDFDLIRSAIVKHEFGGCEFSDIIKDADSISFFIDNLRIYAQTHSQEGTVKKARFMLERVSPHSRPLIDEIIAQDEFISSLMKADELDTEKSKLSISASEHVSYFLGELETLGLSYLGSNLDQLVDTYYSHVPSGDAYKIISRFISDIDKPHKKRWHQFTIAKHTEQLFKAFQAWLADDDLLQELMLSAELKINMLDAFKEKIDGRSKLDLISIALVLHDIGKYVPVIVGTSVDDYIIKYTDHEKRSRQIILDKEFEVNRKLIEQGYTDKQIEYIADIVSLHFDLGYTRRYVMDSGVHEFDLDFVYSDKCMNEFSKIYRDNEKWQYRYEIGLVFLWDTIGKTTIPPMGVMPFQSIRTESQIPDKETLIAWMNEKGIDNSLYPAIKESPTNMGLVKQYFKWLELQTHFYEKYSAKTQSVSYLNFDPQKTKSNKVENGSYVPYYGLTTVCFLNEENPQTLKVRQMYLELKDELQENGLGHTLVFLPESSLHMTITDIYEQGSKPLSESTFASYSDIVSGALMNIPQNGFVKGTIKHLGLKNALTLRVAFDEVNLMKIHAIDQTFKGALKDAGLPVKKDFNGHITLAYVNKVKPEEWLKLKRILARFNDRAGIDYSFDNVDYSYFSSMGNYVPLQSRSFGSE